MRKNNESKEYLFNFNLLFFAKKKQYKKYLKKELNDLKNSVNINNISKTKKIFLV